MIKLINLLEITNKIKKKKSNNIISKIKIKIK